MQRPVVVLPQPLSPTSPNVSPRRRVKSTPSTALTSPTRRRARMPSVTGKNLRRLLTSRSVEASVAGTVMPQLRSRRRSRGRVSTRTGGPPALPARAAAMARAVIDRRRRPALHDAARIHHVDPLGVTRHHPEIVCDNDECRVEPTRQPIHQFEDLRLDGHVERGRRLVCDDELGIAGDRDRDHDALAHAARELVRILLETAGRIGDADQAEQLDGALVRRGTIGPAVLLECLSDLPTDCENGIQRRHRLLEDHADVAAPNFTHLRVRQLHEIAAGEENLAARDPPGRIRNQAQNRQRADGLARSALADDCDCLALLDGIRYPVDGAHNSRTGPELGVQILNLQEWYQHPSRCSPSGYSFYQVSASVSVAERTVNGVEIDRAEQAPQPHHEAGLIVRLQCQYCCHYQMNDS